MSEEDKQVALSMASNGRLIKDIRAELKVDSSTWWKMQDRDPQFAKDFAQARARGFAEMAETIVDVHERILDPQTARVASDNLKTYLSWMDPARFSPKSEIALTGSLDLASVLRAAETRLLPSEREVLQIPSDINELL